MPNQLYVNVTFQQTWKTKLILLAAKPMLILGLWDLDKVSKLVEKSIKVTIEDKVFTK